MAFFCRIRRSPEPADDCRVAVLLSVLGTKGWIAHPLRLDTGCGISIVSETVARALGLPVRGRAYFSQFVPTGGGRLVPARFRFPFDPTTGAPGREVESEWLVVPVTYEYARLGFRDVHPHFALATDDEFVHFAERA